jgi:pre-mRNA-splicing factor CDC5/CEF1
MVKAFIKGGVWKNSEDEILKAAVMKYGKQQWARVASLLNRKSAKQCKARWHEWLDPSVKKIEWSRAEEEKLLHLAKLLPAQWKTIGPLVGRTASQAQEHYEALLDEAAGGTEARNATLQVGQIDAHPETKPARPDPIDMDEDEMEMLQEARARLANTQGKKAKRKARERLLNQAKRLADLQKRRELKQAGLLSGAAQKKAGRMRKRDIDLGVEIPFHKPAPAGFHDVNDEIQRTEMIRQNRIKAVNYHQVNENQYRTRDREAARAEKREEARLKALEKSNMQYVVAQVNKQNDPMNISRKRGILELPAPQISDQELQDLRKIQQDQEIAASFAALNSGSSVTKALVGDYADRPLPTPMKRPEQPVDQVNDLVRQASELRKLEKDQTPLLAGIQPEDENVDDEVLSQAMSRTTPTLLPPNQPLKLQAPLRDELGLNSDDVSVVSGYTTLASGTVASGFTTMGSASIRDLARRERRAAKQARKALEEALASLPAPQFEYELAVPDNQDDHQEQIYQTMEVDMADIEEAEQTRRQEELKRSYEARSTVLKRKELPRPSGATSDMTMTTDSEARALIERETVKLMRYDELNFPIIESEGKKKVKKRKKAASIDENITLDIIPEHILNNAKSILEQETHAMMYEATNKAKELTGNNDSSEFLESILASAAASASRETVSNEYFNEETLGYSDQASELEALKSEFQTIREATMSLRKKNDKVASKISVKNGGYFLRAKALQEDALQSFALMQNHKIECDVFENLAQNEVLGAIQRIEQLEAEINVLEQEEFALQKQYGEVLYETKRLESVMTAPSVPRVK